MQSTAQLLLHTHPRLGMTSGREPLRATMASGAAASGSSAGAKEPPPEFIDPITQDVMTDPVVTADGHTYDRASITKWFDRCRSERTPLTSPCAGAGPLPHATLTPNIALKNLIEAFLHPPASDRPKKRGRTEAALSDKFEAFQAECCALVRNVETERDTAVSRCVRERAHKHTRTHARTHARTHTHTYPHTFAGFRCKWSVLDGTHVGL